MIHGSGLLVDGRKKMAKLGQKEASSSITPPTSRITPPSDYSKGDYSTFILPAILEMQKTLGQLTQAVTTLSEKSKDSGDKLDRISHKVFAAEVVVGIVGSLLLLLGYGLFNLFSKIWDVLSPMIQLKIHP